MSKSRNIALSVSPFLGNVTLQHWIWMVLSDIGIEKKLSTNIVELPICRSVQGSDLMFCIGEAL